jgi:sporulation protein YlmC with PRC-barrel domain
MIADVVAAIGHCAATGRDRDAVHQSAFVPGNCRVIGTAQSEKPSSAGTADASVSFLLTRSGRNQMFAKSVIAGLAGAGLLATAAFAQTPATSDGANAAPMSNSSLHGDWRTSKVVGLSVYNDNNESIGSINDLLTDKGGNIKAVVLGVGGFLGVGAHLVAVPYDKMKFVNEPIAYTGVAGSPNGAGSRPASSPVTTGAASGTTTGAATGSASASKANPWYPDHAVFNATKDQLKAMPEFKYSTE